MHKLWIKLNIIYVRLMVTLLRYLATAETLDYNSIDEKSDRGIHGKY